MREYTPSSIVSGISSGVSVELRVHDIGVKMSKNLFSETKTKKKAVKTINKLTFTEHFRYQTPFMGIINPSRVSRTNADSNDISNLTKEGH